MAYSKQFACDVCGSQKKVTNNWFLVEVSATRISISAFDSTDAKLKRFVILCGENCLQKYLSQNLDFLQTHPQSPVYSETIPAPDGVGARGRD
jgi:transcription elongation factor Elf1